MGTPALKLRFMFAGLCVSAQLRVTCKNAGDLPFSASQGARGRLLRRLQRTWAVWRITCRASLVAVGEVQAELDAEGVWDFAFEVAIKGGEGGFKGFDVLILERGAGHL